MSSPGPDLRKRPPPIAIPQWPPSRTVPEPDPSINAPVQTRGTSQHPQRFASSSTQQAVRSSTTTPLTSPLEPNESRLALPKSGSQASKHRSSAMTTLSELMDQARGSPRKSDHSSIVSRHGSTARSRQSERSHRSAVAAQARLEALDEDQTTLRSQIESHTEQKLFKMTGQIPPTPITEAMDPDRVFIRTEDLRAQCRAASSEKQAESDESTKSPKKKLFGVSFPTFTRTATTSATPAMPPKAAQILGAPYSHKPRHIQPRPIRSTQVLKTPTKPQRSDTGKSLPAKVYGDHYVKNHHNHSTRGNRTTGRRSPGKENTTPHELNTANLSFESMPPPTPPAKDTPPEFRHLADPPSPLRRAPSHDDLRESYGAISDKGIQVRLPFPMFALSPSPPKTAIPGKSGLSPTKYRPYTAEDYTKLIEGEALQWRYPDEDVVGEVKESNYSAPLVQAHHEPLQLPQSSRSDDDHYNERLGRRMSPLPPRFYSPSNRSVQLFNDGESPSQNTDTSRMLFVLPKPKPSLLHLCEDSNNGSIEMVYQGSMKAVESDPSESQPRNSSDAQTQEKQAQDAQQQRNNNELAARVKQELGIGEQHQQCSAPNGSRPHVQSDISSSKLTDTWNGASVRIDSNSDFRPFCPSAVPSPLHKLHGPHVPVAPIPMLRGGNGTPTAGQFASPRTKTIDDHFYMTNEHLDVVGKTTYDALDMFTKQQINAANAKHEDLARIIEMHIENLQSRFTLVNDKADTAANQTHNIGLKLDQLEDFFKDEVIGALTEQTKKVTEVEMSLKEIQKAMAHMQQTVEKLSESRPTAQHLTTNTLPASGTPSHAAPTQYVQSAPNNYYTNDASRDEQAQMPPQHRNAPDSYESHGDQRGSYGTGWQSQAWNGRSTYNGRNKAETTSYAGTNPYHFGNGGQYNNGYVNGGYPSYNYSAASPEQPYAYGQKPAQ